MLKKKNYTLDLTYEDFSFILTAVSAMVHEMDEDYLYVDHLDPDSDDFKFIDNDWIYAILIMIGSMQITYIVNYLLLLQKTKIRK